MKWLATIAMTTIVAAWAAPASAQPRDDYEVGSRAWNGLSKLEAIAEGMNLEVVAVDQIDWDELGAYLQSQVGVSVDCLCKVNRCSAGGCLKLAAHSCSDSCSDDRNQQHCHDQVGQVSSEENDA